MRKKKIPKKLIVVLSAVFVCAVAFWVARAWGPAPGGARKAGVFTFRPWRRPAEPKPLPPRPKPVPAQPSPVPAFPAARMAIILDDWGMSETLLADAVALKRPITLSVLPHLPHSESIARAAAQNGLGVMLHMPMQPRGANQPKEPETIRTDTPDADIRRFLDAALASVPGARGVNNHQGSAATSDHRVMKTVLEHLKGKGLFFVDSFVIASTTGPAAAREVGIPFARRDAFIDNVAQKEAVKKELRKAIAKALRNKRVVVIGHDKRPTLDAIRETIPLIDKSGVQLVLVQELAQVPS